MQKHTRIVGLIALVVIATVLILESI